MSRADDVAAWVRKAAEHPRAPILFAIAGASSSPTNAAQTAREVGLLNDEEKLTKWVAVLKREAEVLYGMSFEAALCTILAQGDKTMKVVKGFGFYEARVRELFDRVMGEWRYTTAGPQWAEIEHLTHRFQMRAPDGRYLFSDSGISERVYLRAKSKESMPVIRKLAHRLEAMTRRKNFQEVPTEVTILQDF